MAALCELSSSSRLFSSFRSAPHRTIVNAPPELFVLRSSASWDTGKGRRPPPSCRSSILASAPAPVPVSSISTANSAVLGPSSATLMHPAPPLTHFSREIGFTLPLSVNTGASRSARLPRAAQIFTTRPASSARSARASPPPNTATPTPTPSTSRPNRDRSPWSGDLAGSGSPTAPPSPASTRSESSRPPASKTPPAAAPPATASPAPSSPTGSPASTRPQAPSSPSPSTLPP